MDYFEQAAFKDGYQDKVDDLNQGVLATTFMALTRSSAEFEAYYKGQEAATLDLLRSENNMNRD